jgi:hypothetical protein
MLKLPSFFKLRMVFICQTISWQMVHEAYVKKKKRNSVALVRKRTVPIERPPLIGEVSAKFCGENMSRGQRDGSPRPLISIS